MFKSTLASFMNLKPSYRAALEVKTRERFPVEWAALQNKLGDALVE